MRPSLATGFSFGLTSGVITTLGLMVGLYAGTRSQSVVIGGILTIAIADAMSDAMGIHIAEESKNSRTEREIWESTAATFLTKFGVALAFVVPVLALPLRVAIVASIIWGLALLAVLSFVLARMQRLSPWKVIVEHVMIGIAVITATHYVGDWIGARFG